jgi:hypothetical protein
MGDFGWWDRVELHDADLAQLVASFPADIQVVAGNALNDIANKRHCHYAAVLHRAYCFQRQGLTFVWQYWVGIATRDIAERLFARFPDSQLPFPDAVAEHVYRAALTH